MNSITYFEIQASEPALLIEFYGQVFAWEFQVDSSLPIEYYRISTPGIEGGLLRRQGAILPPGHGTNAFACSILVADIDKTERKILEQGGKIAMEKFPAGSLGWQGYYLDPDNNVFGLFQMNKEA